MDKPMPRQFDEAAALDLGRRLCELSAHVELRFETPAGIEIAPPRRPPLADGPVKLREQHRDLEIGPETPVAGWRGERGDLHYVADVYSEAAYRARTRAGPVT